VQLWTELEIALREISKRSDDRVVVITGAGGQFCAGGPSFGPSHRSAPAQNSPPAPVITTTRSSLRLEISRKAISSSVQSCTVAAFFFAGRFSV
jgi:hypothetical protein